MNYYYKAHLIRWFFKKYNLFMNYHESFTDSCQKEWQISFSINECLPQEFLKKIIKNKDKCLFDLFNGFQWSNTEDGFSYWCGIHAKWITFLENKCNMKYTIFNSIQTSIKQSQKINYG